MKFPTEDEWVKTIGEKVLNDYIIDGKPLKEWIDIMSKTEIKHTAEQTYDWCKGCKEYDTEKHCCHRYSSFIRESLQDSINAVLEDIKVEIDKQTDIHADGELYIKNIDVKRILDKHISGKEDPKDAND